MLERLLERETGARQIVLMRGARESGRMRDCGAIKIGIIKGAIGQSVKKLRQIFYKINK